MHISHSYLIRIWVKVQYIKKMKKNLIWKNFGIIHLAYSVITQIKYVVLKKRQRCGSEKRVLCRLLSSIGPQEFNDAVDVQASWSLFGVNLTVGIWDKNSQMGQSEMEYIMACEEQTHRDTYIDSPVHICTLSLNFCDIFWIFWCPKLRYIMTLCMTCMTRVSWHMTHGHLTCRTGRMWLDSLVNVHI